MNIAVSAPHPSLQRAAQQLAQRLRLPLLEDGADKSYDYLLQLTPQGLQLLALCLPRTTPLRVDCLSGRLAHRRRYGGGRRQLLARAIGLTTQRRLHVIDVTAGLGADGFVLAYLGCEVTLLERSPIIAALLADGVQRALADPSCADLKLQVIHADARDYLAQLKQPPDVIYCDPMFPLRSKSALVKKEMRMLRDIVGEDNDAGELVDIALKTARKRLVVKRPRLAPPLPGPPADVVFTGKRCRFDVYLVGR